VDFVVVGLGLGALGVLLGVVMLGWLAPRAQRAARTASPEDAARHLAVAAERRGTGHAFLYAGAALLLATTGGLVGALDDRTGALLVTTTATVAAVGILLAGFLHRARNPVPRRRRPSRAVELDAALAERAQSASLVLTDIPSGVGETVRISPDDNGDASIDPYLPQDPVPDASVAGDAVPEPSANGRSTFGALETGAVEDMPISASPALETESIPDQVDDPGDDATGADDEEVVVVGFVVPAASPSNAPSPPSRREDGEDPS
jgi:hypothetical protein